MRVTQRDTDMVTNLANIHQKFKIQNGPDQNCAISLFDIRNFVLLKQINRLSFTQATCMNEDFCDCSFHEKYNSFLNTC